MLRGLRWGELRAAAEQGDGPAQDMLSWMLLEGDGVAGLRGAVLVRRRINRRSQRLTETYLDWRRDMLEAERLELQEMRDEGVLPDPVMRNLLREVEGCSVPRARRILARVMSRLLAGA